MSQSTLQANPGDVSHVASAGVRHDSAAGWNLPPAGSPLVMVRAAKCGACETEMRTGFIHPTREWSYLFPFVVPVSWVLNDLTCCGYCEAIGKTLFVTEPYADPYAELGVAA